MVDTTARLLRLLGELQAHAGRSGPELAERLDVTPRTIRRDIGRLRRLGYDIEAEPGIPGYRLAGGASMPPLLLEPDEATAVAVALRTAAVLGGVEGIQQDTLAALAKLEQVLPEPLRPRVAAIEAAVETTEPSGPTVPADVLSTLAAACRDHRQLDIDYRDHHGERTDRRTEPHRLVHNGRHWYLVAWDTTRADWRTFRVDRLALHHPPGARFTPRRLPKDSAAAMVSAGIASVLWPHRETVHIAAPVARAAHRHLPTGWTLEADTDTTCLLHAGAANPARLALYLIGLGLDFEVAPDSPLIDPLGVLADRARRAMT